MAAAIRADAMPERFVRLVATARLHAEPQRVAEILDSDGGPWRDGRLDQRDGLGPRRYAIDLRLRLGGDSARLVTFSKAAFLDLGRVRRVGDGWEVEVGWRASTAAPLFPVFSGRLFIGREGLRIDGLYAPPGGVAGRVADRLLLHVAANGTARWLLEEIDRAALGAAG